MRMWCVTVLFEGLTEYPQVIEMTITMLGKHLNEYFPMIFTALKSAQTIPELHEYVCRVSIIPRPHSSTDCPRSDGVQCPRCGSSSSPS